MTPASLLRLEDEESAPQVTWLEQKQPSADSWQQQQQQQQQERPAADSWLDLALPAPGPWSAQEHRLRPGAAGCRGLDCLLRRLLRTDLERASSGERGPRWRRTQEAGLRLSLRSDRPGRLSATPTVAGEWPRADPVPCEKKTLRNEIGARPRCRRPGQGEKGLWCWPRPVLTDAVRTRDQFKIQSPFLHTGYMYLSSVMARDSRDVRKSEMILIPILIAYCRRRERDIQRSGTVAHSDPSDLQNRAM